MDNANMSQGSDKQNSSDDLIAELARLMASDAKGPTGAEDAAPAAAPEVDQRAEPQITSAEPAPVEPAPVETAPATPAPAETTPSSPTPNVFAPAPKSAPEATTAPTEPHFGAAPASASETSDPFAPQTPAVPETFTSSKDNLFAPVAPERDSFAEPPVTATPAKPEETVSRETNPSAAEAPKASTPNDGFDLELPPLKPISPDTFADEQSAPAPYTAQRSFETPSEPEVVVQPEPAPEPETPSFAQQSTFAQESSAPFTPEASVDVAPVEPTAPSPAPTAATADEMDPIAALIAEQLKEADRVQPGMARAQEQSSLRPSDPEPAPEPFRRTSSFGVDSGADAPNLSKPARDPLDDIESLIGAALRNEGAQPQATPQPAAPQPAPDAFAAPPQPEAQPTAPLDNAAASAEAAILAATDSMRGANTPADSQPFVAPPSQDGQTHGAQAAGAQTTGSRRAAIPSVKMPAFNLQKLAGPLVAAALLIAVGLGVYWIFGTGGPEEGEAPVLSADTSPVKQAPDATTPDTPSSVVFSENDNADEPDTIERLISRDETADAAGNDVSRVISTNSNSDGGLANRKVRTVTVRPDGTIVSGGSAVAGGEQLPVDRPNVPAIPGSTVETASAPITTPTTTPTTGLTTTTDSSIVAPIPLPRPTGRASAPTAPAVTTTPVAAAPSASSNSNAVNLIADSARQAVSAPAVTPPASVPVTTGTNAPAYVQLSSQRNQEAARQSLNRVSSRYAAQLGNNQLEIQQVDLGERGIFYRVRMPAQSLESANSVCANIKASGGDCFVRTN